MSASLEHVFPATRGTQSGKDFFLSVCPMHLATKLFRFRDSELPESIRASRGLSDHEVQRIADYLVSNPRGYVIPPICVSVDADVLFQPITADSELGHLHIPMAATLVVTSGENTLAAIERATAKVPALLLEQVAIVFYPDKRLKRAAKMYSDFKTLAMRPSASLRRLHSADDDIARLTRELIGAAEPFKGIVEMKRSSLAPRSKMLFTFSSVSQATKALLHGIPVTGFDERLKLAVSFWTTVDSYFPEWRLVRTGKMLSSELRARFIHAHGAVLLALGKAGNALLLADRENWQSRLCALSEIDWSRENANTWEGRALVSGKVSKALPNVLLTTNLIKTALGLRLNEAEVSAKHPQEIQASNQ